MQGLAEMASLIHARGGHYNTIYGLSGLGDLIATGTCVGVGIGIGFNPPKYLQKGDRVAITIEPIGTLENPVA